MCAAHRDGHEPGSHPLWLLQPSQRAGGLQKRLLDDVVELCRVAHQAIDNAGQIARMAPVEGREGGLVGLPRALDERRVADAFRDGAEHRKQLAQHHGDLVRRGAPFGQRSVIEAFLRSRTSAAEPLIAYRLNWKGENFYTGNRLAIFVSSGEPFRRYVNERRLASPWLHVALETQRLGSLRAELGLVKALDVLTTPAESDKISLVRVQLY
jgi:hypothetical protein